MPLGDFLRLKRSHLETPSRSPKNTWVSTHQLPVLPKKNVQKENRTKKIEEIPPVGKLPTKSGFFFHPHGAQRIAPMSTFKVGKIFSYFFGGERLTNGWLWDNNLNSQKRRCELSNLQLFNFSSKKNSLFAGAG